MPSFFVAAKRRRSETAVGCLPAGALPRRPGVTNAFTLIGRLTSLSKESAY
jgi:hypothetical protein